MISESHWQQMKEESLPRALTAGVLREGFLKNLDVTRVEAWLAGTRKYSKPLLGEGSCFHVWKFDNIVVHELKSLKVNKKKERWVSGWLQAMERLEKLEIPLIPPVKLLNREDFVAYIKPFGEYPSFPAKIPLTWAKQLDLDLAEHGLRLTDSDQVVFCKGIPFLYDLSDLRLSTDKQQWYW